MFGSNMEENRPLLSSLKNVCYINRPLLASFLASIMSFASGTVVAGWTAPEKPNFTGETLFAMENMEKMSLVVSIYVFGALVGALPASRISQTIGLKRLLMLISFPMHFGWLFIMLFANNVYLIYVGRLLCGLSLGAATVVIPLYNYDIAPNVCRGKGGVYLDFMLCAGILYSYMASSVMGLAAFSFTCSLIPVVFLVLFSFMPESPRYLHSRSQYVDARAALRWLRGLNYDVDGEFDMYAARLGNNDDSAIECIPGNKNMEKKSTFVKAIVLSLALATIQRMSGAGAIVQFTGKLFKISGSSVEPITASIITGIFQLIGSAIAVVLIDKLGRRKLLLVSSSAVVTCLLTLTLYFYFLDKGMLISSLKVLPIVIVCAFIFFFRIGLGPIPWFITSELLGSGSSYRNNRVQSYVASYSWTLSFLVMQSFIPLINNWPVALWFGYSILSVVGLVVILFYVPETNNKSSDEIHSSLLNTYQITIS